MFSNITKDRTLLIDGDILCHIVAQQAETPIKWDEDLWTLHASEQESIDKLSDTITYYQTTLLCKEVVIALSHKNNYRKKVYPNYKSNRKGVRKPLTYQPLREWLHKNFQTHEYPNLEGDDVLGLLATSDLIEGEKIILTKDKDLKTIPSTIWFMNGKNEYTTIDKKEADYNFMKQTLMGDTVDGYKGCPRVGEVSAERILQKHKGDKKAMWQAVLHTYRANGIHRAAVIVQARLARILRKGEYDFTTHKPKLWRPTSYE